MPTNLISNVTAIVLGVDTPIGLALLRDLGKNGVTTVGVGRTKNAIGFASKHCHHTAVRPEGGDDTALVSHLLELAAQYSASYLLAISEGDLLYLNRHRRVLEKSLVLLTPERDILAQVLDKERCLEIARSVGIATPATFQFGTLAEAQTTIPSITFPVVMKWRDPNIIGHKLASAGLPLHKTEYAQNPEDLMSRLGRYSMLGEFPLVQEYCPGHGLGQMFLVKDGAPLLEFQHQRLQEWPPEGGVSCLSQSVPLELHRAARERSLTLLKALNWRGVAMVEYRFDPESDTYWLMEINGRYWGSLPLAIAAGVPFAAAAIYAQQGRKIDPDGKDYGQISCCYAIPQLRSLFRLFFERSKIVDPNFRPAAFAQLMQFLATLVNPFSHYYVFQWQDSGPFWADMRNVAKGAMARIFNR